MRPIRIIPKLDIKGPNLVKGIHLEGLRVLGRPEDFVRQYYADGADELIYIDIVASLYGRNNLLDIVRRTAEKVFIPLTVGGGIRSVDDIRNVLRAGADKVAINTAAIKDPDLIKKGSRIFGSQCIVVSIEAKHKANGRHEAMTDNGRQETGVDVLDWARRAYELGAGELLVTSIDRDGTGEGYDIELLKAISETVPIPVIGCGGAGKIEHMEDIVRNTCISGISAASIFHYHYIDKRSHAQKFEEGNIDFLKRFTQVSSYAFRSISPVSILDMKKRLSKCSDKIYVRFADLHQDEDKRGAAKRVASGQTSRVAVIDYGCGNLFSIAHALEEIGANFLITDDHEEISLCDKLIIPGVGSFKEGMKNLNDRKLVEPIVKHARSGKGILGICLGMQLLMSSSEEFGDCLGLDLIRGKALKVILPKDRQSFIKIPHVGWNKIMPTRKYKAAPKVVRRKSSWKETILKDIPEGSLMYFVHSYAVFPDHPEDILSETTYGPTTFASVIKKDNIYGCQFHPERSGELGLDIYRKFVCGMSDGCVVCHADKGKE